MKICRSLLFLLFILGGAFQTMGQNDKSYLALGDSYTIGEAVDSTDTWSFALSKILTSRGIPITLDKIIATTGWTTDELLSAINSDTTLEKSNYDLVSLLIGVNNQYRGYGIVQYKEEFEELLRKAISLAGNKTKHVFVLSIPDYGVTTFASENDKNGEVIANELREYNKIARNLSEEYGVTFFDITPISLNAIWDPSFVAKDKLHPSEKMYEEWANYIAPGVFQLLEH